MGDITLSRGSHAAADDEMSALETASWLSGEPHSDRPYCVSGVIAVFVRRWNNDLHDDDRTRLLSPLIPIMIGTASTPPDVDERRRRMCLDWLVHICVPAWIDLVPELSSHAAALRACDTSRRHEWDTVEWLASQAASRLASQADATARPGSACWDAPRASARSAARDAVAYQCLEVSHDLSTNAISASASAITCATSCSTSYSDAMATLRPTVERLQASACDLIREMCEARS